jgi:hypothetical protein
MMKQQEKNYYIQQKLPKVSMQLLEKKRNKFDEKKIENNDEHENVPKI